MNGLDIAKVICPHAWDEETRTNKSYREWALGLADEILTLHQRETYKSFTDGMEAAAEICGSLAETTYDDSDSFEAATGCEASIMAVVRQQRREQAASVDRNPEGEKPQALSAEHESAAPKADAQPSTPEIEAEISRLQVGGL